MCRDRKEMIEQKRTLKYENKMEFNGENKNEI